MKKLITIVGTRPEIIRLSVISRILDRNFQQILVDTQQNFEPNLNSIFWSDLNMRTPDYRLTTRGSTTGEYLAHLLVQVEKILITEKPDGAVILGDTYSGLSAIICERYGVPVFHLEAGNRCWDDSVPEERNRKIIDATSAFNLAYTNHSLKNLYKCGRTEADSFVVGNPILEVMNFYKDKRCISEFPMPERFLLATLHRSECVDNLKNLQNTIIGLGKCAEHLELPCVLMVHPRLKSKLSASVVAIPDRVILRDACGFLEFQHIERKATAVLSDSGTVPEECCLLGIPSVTLRPVTERQELLDAGSTICSGYDPDNILSSLNMVMDKRSWIIPPEYLEPQVSKNVSQIISDKI